MDERLPYDKLLSEQLNDLPLPDESMAWDDMQRRLNEDDDNKPVAWWRRGCLRLGFLIIVLLGVGFWMLKPVNLFDRKEKTATTIATVESSQKENRNLPNKKINADSEKNSVPKNKNITEGQLLYNDSLKLKTSSADKKNLRIISASDKKTMTNKNISEIIRENKSQGLTVIKIINSLNNKTKKINFSLDKLKSDKREHLINFEEKQKGISQNTEVENKEINNLIILTAEKQKTESGTLIKEATDTLDTNKQTKTTEEIVPNKDFSKNNKEIVEKKKLIYSAGIGLQQQLPVAGQKLNPYNAQGRRGSLADYIPSVNFRITKPVKWFAQTEFKYGAPQLTKEFIYKQIILQDSSTNPRFKTTFSNAIKKTYYHQVPITFNYFIYKNWSIGAGIQWNSFKVAIAEQKQIVYDNFTQQDSVYSKKIIRVNKDSTNNFKKSYFQGIIESQYKWKRFSVGARYNFGLQPYIEFTLPGGKPQQEKNASLQIFINYELWKFKRK